MLQRIYILSGSVQCKNFRFPDTTVEDGFYVSAQLAARQSCTALFDNADQTVWVGSEVRRGPRAQKKERVSGLASRRARDGPVRTRGPSTQSERMAAGGRNQSINL